MDAAPAPLQDDLAPALLGWFEAARRDLPWRRDRDPYRIWVAEVLLQQTRVAQATPYFERFLRRFPTVEALAAAELDEVRKLWEGAGYYRRAENLWRAAREVGLRHRGQLPRTVPELRELPGVGPYIAAAIASLAFGVRVPAVDANARRVGARWLGETGSLSGAAVRRRIEVAIERALPPDRPGPFNEAVMELGETICTPRSPRCGSCPVATWCVAGRTLADPGTIPPRSPARRKPHHTASVVVLERGGRWWVQRRGPTGLLAGLWEFPGGHLEADEPPEDGARRELLEETGWRAGALESLGIVRHEYSHFSVALHVFRGAPARSGPRPPGNGRWVTPAEFETLARPMATRKVARLATLAPRGRASRGSGSRRGPASP